MRLARALMWAAEKVARMAGHDVRAAGFIYYAKPTSRPNMNRDDDPVEVGE